MNFKFDVQAMLATLPMMLKGMVCIFIVAGAIILIIMLCKPSAPIDAEPVAA